MSRCRDRAARLISGGVSMDTAHHEGQMYQATIHSASSALLIVFALDIEPELLGRLEIRSANRARGSNNSVRHRALCVPQRAPTSPVWWSTPQDRLGPICPTPDRHRPAVAPLDIHEVGFRVRPQDLRCRHRIVIVSKPVNRRPLLGIGKRMQSAPQPMSREKFQTFDGLAPRNPKYAASHIAGVPA